VVLSANLPGVADNALKLTPEIVVDIFLGQVDALERPAHRRGEPRAPPPEPADRAELPCRRLGHDLGVHHLPLARLERVEGGTGRRHQRALAVGNGARGNEGVSNIIRNTPGAIGYIENAYAVVNKMTTTQLRNKSGSFVRPEPPAFNAAAAAADWIVPNFAADTIDLNGATVWPITSPTYILLPTNPPAEKVDASRNTMRFFDWAFRNGSEIASRLEYIRCRVRRMPSRTPGDNGFARRRAAPSDRLTLA
jgi:phosphate transport system substrate-binding protein